MTAARTIKIIAADMHQDDLETILRTGKELEDVQFQVTAAGTRSSNDPTQSHAAHVKDQLTTFWRAQASAEYHSLPSSSPEALFEEACEMNGFEALVIDANSPSDSRSLLTSIAAKLVPALTVKFGSGIWRTNDVKMPWLQRAQTDAARDSEKPMQSRRASLFQMFQRKSAENVCEPASPKPSSTSDTANSNSQSLQDSPRTSVQTLFTEPEDIHPIDHSQMGSQSSARRKSSLARIGRTLTRTFSNSDVRNRPSSKSIPFPPSSKPLNERDTDLYDRQAKIIIICDHPERDLSEKLYKLITFRPQTHLGNAIEGYQRRRGLRYHVFCLLGTRWPHLDDEIVRPAYTRRCRSGHTGGVSKESIVRLNPRAVQFYIVHSSRVSEVLPNLLACNRDEEFFTDYFGPSASLVSEDQSFNCDDEDRSLLH